jgi:uncharacterized protein YjiS (DUF1127 family)
MTACAHTDLTDYHAIPSRPGGWRSALGRALQRWRDRDADRRAVASLTDRDLHDMGRTRWELENALSRRFRQG